MNLAHAVSSLYSGRRLDTLRMSWSRVQSARGYEVRITNVYTPYIVFADSSVAIEGLGRTIHDDPIFFASPDIVTTAVVSAVDDNYYEYYRSLSDPFSGTTPSHLTGGIGVFGSIVQLQIRQLTVQ